MNERKASCAKTRVSWDFKRAIWERWALGETVQDTLRFFDLNPEKYRNAPSHRDTVSKVRSELRRLSVSQVRRLVEECPVTRGLVQRERPERHGELESLETVVVQLPRAETHRDDPLIVEAKGKHFEDLRDVIKTLVEQVHYMSNPSMYEGLSMTPDPRIWSWTLDIREAGPHRLTECRPRVEYDTLFTCLQQHLAEELWKLYEEWKQVVTSAEVVRRRTPEDELHDATYYNTVNERKRLGSQLTALLEKARARRFFDGRCECCP